VSTTTDVDVGDHVSVYWVLDQAWYNAVVISFNENSGKHQVQYDIDDEFEILDFSKENFITIDKNVVKKKRKRKKEDGSKKDKVVKYQGVWTKGEKFQAVIRIDGKMNYLGMFDTAKKAAEAYDRGAIQAGRPLTKLNFQDKVHKAYKPSEKRSNNTTGYTGVMKNGNRFAAQIRINGTLQYLGQFDTTKEAAIAFDLAAIQANRSKDLNFPDMIHESNSNNMTEEDVNRNLPGRRPHRGLVKYRGVSKNGNKFVARISVNDKRQCLGTFDTSKDAAIAYDFAAIQAKRLKSELNFPLLHDCRVIESSPKIKKRRVMR